MIFEKRANVRLVCSDHEYSRILRSRRLWPVEPMIEQDWSGRGQHAEFQKEERPLVDEILKTEELLGSTSSAVVQSVKCKRILLARKTIRCNRHLTKEEAVDEVAHLHQINHAHVIRVIGTYIMGQDLSILLYPVAEYNLESFLEEYTTQEYWLIFLLGRRLDSLRRFFRCLSSAMDYIHSAKIKHMDIKPKNLLVRRTTTKTTPLGVDASDGWRIYIADFGIAKSYTTIEETETDGPTRFTRKYAAPEVVDQAKRGLSADVFSMGCVFIEILATIIGIREYFNALDSANTVQIGRGCGDHLSALRRLLATNDFGDTSYQANLTAVRSFLDQLHSLSTLERNPQFIRWVYRDGSQSLWGLADLTGQMLDVDPLQRPSAADIVLLLGRLPCCTAGSDQLEAVNPAGKFTSLSEEE